MTAALCPAIGGGPAFAQTTRGLYTDSTGTNIGIGTTTPQGALVVTNGNVGIGTWSPASKLTISGGTGQIFDWSGGGTSRQYFAMVNTGAYGILGIGASTAASIATGDLPYATVLDTNNATALQFGTNGNIRATIDSGGNVGIGSTVPNIGSYTTAITGSAGASGDSTFGLELQGARTVDGKYAKIDFYHKTNLTAFIESDRAGADNSAVLYFGTANAGAASVKMTIDKTGSVGVAKTTPSAWHSSYSGKGILQIGIGGGIWTDSGADDLFIGSNYYIPASGAETYIGSGKAANIYITAGDINFRNTNTSGTADGTITWATPLKITSAGNVGIGSTAPGKLLDVAGIARATGILTKTGVVTLNSGVATTMFSAASNGMYIVMALIDGGVAASYTAEAIIISNNGTPIIMQQVNGSLLTITLSGANVQTTQNSGASSTVTWSYVLIPY